MLKFYEKELQFVRGMGKEFAERYPGVAERLDLGGLKALLFFQLEFNSS